MKRQAQVMTDKAANEGMVEGRVQQADAMQQMMEANAAQEQKAVDMQEIAHAQEMEKIAVKEGAKTERDMLKNNRV